MKKFLLTSLIFLSALPIAMAQTNRWVDTFSIYVTKIALPSISTNTLSINVPEGETASSTLLLSNAGNIDVDFSLTGDGAYSLSPHADYLTTTQSAIRVSFSPLQHPDSTLADSTVAMDIGFPFPKDEIDFTQFIANLDGTLTLVKTSTRQSLNPGLNSSFTADSVRYLQESNRLVVAWGVDPDSTTFEYGALQIWIYSDGSYQYLFANDSISSVVNDSVLMIPQVWISASPTSGTIPAGGSIPVTFTVNAENQSTGESFTANVLFSNGSNSAVTVNMVVEGQTLDLPAAPTFYGSAGLITSTNIIVTNSGSTALSYAISYPSGTYTADQVDYANNWITGGTTVQNSNLGNKSFDLGFPFTFFGNVYTSLVINEDGSITLDSDRTIQAFSQDLLADEDTTITFRTDLAGTRAVVTWNNLSPTGSNDDYKFQAILNRDGTIRCNYEKLGTDWPDGVIRIINGTTEIDGSLINDETFTNVPSYVYETNKVPLTTIGQRTVYTNAVSIVETNSVATYKFPIPPQALQFTPSERQVISASPVTGLIGAGETAVIKLTGDARSLNDGGSSDVTASTILSFIYSGTTKTLTTTFIATNSVDAAYPSLAPAELASMWGTPYVPNVWTEQDGPGTARTIYWPAPEDGLSRVYTVWYTDSLTSPFESITEAGITNGFQFIDEDFERINSVQAFYKVTVR